ncbi:tripartite tricarboxylate transporter TctB family protein [Psychrobacillus soli]|uniref:Tripartite tricarboxylate transporter TctB family protein n=1 Tax=Psychrobacillus soli TaxID=1543965 RepID=A0A544SY56_9BACI|nr:tripartite tricarboxylate transporter TctB family protein [Psychrobacillus soli]TQR10136.1 tripartite tricarboxylate transporter TctB family protein [Psychrobacillus soli]
MAYGVIVLIYIISGYFLYESTKFGGDAGIFPRMVSGAIIFINTIYLYQTIKEQKENSKEIEKERNKLPIKPSKQFYVISILSILYIALLSPIGFLIVTPIYLASIMFYLGGRSKKMVFICSIAFTFVIYFFFTSLLHITIPQGILNL